ncbi:MAG: hypothetical protein U5K74_12370 [Gemmatimonadaceae bacterium]|nr:hypothetical protein [Gemmatimonadaceae bacterium]
MLRALAVVLALCTALMTTPSVVAAQSAAATASAQDIDLVEVAVRLSEFGYKSIGPEALLVAAQIAMDSRARRLAARPNAAVAGAVSDDTVPAFDVEALLARAEAMAPTDTTIRTLVERLRTRLRGTPRGLLQGPRLATYSIDGGGLHEFRLAFAPDQPAVVRVRAASVTNFTCAVIDARGRTLREDKSTSYCVLNFRPDAPGQVRIRITSAAAVPSGYLLITN